MRYFFTCITVLCAVLLCANPVFSQYQFKNKKNAKSHISNVYFKILGITDVNKAETLELEFQALPQIKNAQIKYNYKCYLELSESIDAKKVRDVLLNHNTYFYFPSLDVNDSSLYNNINDYKENMIPEDFPIKEDYNTKQDYYDDLNKWKTENPGKLSILKELGYLL